MKFGYGSLCSPGAPGPTRAEGMPWAACHPISAVLLGELLPLALRRLRLNIAAASSKHGEMPSGITQETKGDKADGLVWGARRE